MKEHSCYDTKTWVEAWNSLVHMLWRWRRIVFGSPHRLNLQPFCTPTIPSRDTLDVWPALPLLIHGNMTLSSGVDNIIVALGHSNHVCEVNLWVAGWQQLEKVLAVMQVPFLELIKLWLFSNDEMPPVIPNSFLGGSAPHLWVFKLKGVSFLGLPKLLLSATHLVHLYIVYIPHSGYISPNAMVALLSMLSSLEWLSLGFESP